MTGDDQIGRLLRLAGRRPAPDPVQMARAREAARLEWSRQAARRTSRTFWLTGAVVLTASALALAVWGWTRPSVAAPPADVGSVQRVTGSLFVTRPGQPRRSIIAAGTPVQTGDVLETTDGGRAALLQAIGVSIRLDRDTAVTFVDGHRVSLGRGAVYVDSGADRRGPGVQIVTPLGSVRHVGTQFEVRLEQDGLQIRVREGTIALDAGGRDWTSAAGQSLVLVRGRAPEAHAISTTGPDWNWVAQLAPPFRLEGAAVAAFLDWVSREQGWRWEYDSAATKARMERVVLHGSIDGLLPEEALAAVLPTCGLTSRRDGDRLIVSAPSGRDAGR